MFHHIWNAIRLSLGGHIFLNYYPSPRPLWRNQRFLSRPLRSERICHNTERPFSCQDLKRFPCYHQHQPLPLTVPGWSKFDGLPRWGPSKCPHRCNEALGTLQRFRRNISWLVKKTVRPPQDNTKLNSASPPPPAHSCSSDQETLFFIAVYRIRHRTRHWSHISVLSFGCTLDFSAMVVFSIGWIDWLMLSTTGMPFW